MDDLVGERDGRVQLPHARALKPAVEATRCDVFLVDVHCASKERAEVAAPQVRFFDEDALAFCVRCGVRKDVFERRHHAARDREVGVRAHCVGAIARVRFVIDDENRVAAVKHARDFVASQ